MFVGMFLGVPVLMVGRSLIFLMSRKIEASQRWLSLAMNEAQIDTVVAGMNLLKTDIWVNDCEGVKREEYSYLQSTPTGMRHTRVINLCREG